MRRTGTVVEAVQALRRAGGRGEPLVVASPGRVNVLGEHTDYNQGLCLPAAADLHVVVAAVPLERPDLLVHEGDEQMHLALGTPLDSIPEVAPSWSSLVMAVADELGRLGRPQTGMVAGVAADLPVGAGMSSSAAFGIGMAMALSRTARWDVSPEDLVGVSQKAEKAAFGVPCGLLDQMTVVHGQEGCALLLDCRTGEFRPVHLPEEAGLVVADSGIRRRLKESEYGTRVEECREASRRLGLPSLREVTLADLDRVQGELDGVLFRRVRHVVKENARVLSAIESDAVSLGGLISESHRSLSRDYEVSLPALDDLVGRIESLDGVLGARVMGAGFGGSILVLCVQTDAVAVRDEVAGLAGHGAWVTEPGAGVRVLEADMS